MMSGVTVLFKDNGTVEKTGGRAGGVEVLCGSNKDGQN